ncbi:MAG: hypothetical protein R6W96_05165 [Clostridia bacterium]
MDASTLDECAYAYRPMDEIIDNMRETAELVEVIRLLYNFKSAEQHQYFFRYSLISQS